MSESLGKATLELEADGSGLDRDLADFERKAGDAGDRSSKSFGSKFSGGVKSAMLPAAAALGAILVGAKKSTDAASALSESINAVNVVFGDAGGKILEFGKIADREAGLSARAFQEMSTPIGASLQNVGFSADEAADASIALTKRAADMASVFGGPVEDALGAIQAGLRGEADPLERFGVGLSETAVTAHALELGLAKTAAELTANDKAQARLSLLMEQTNANAGDFKNTIGEVANAEKASAAEAENLAASYGQALLPAREALNTVMGVAMGFLSEHQTLTLALVGVVAGLAVGVFAVAAAMKVYAAGQALATAAVWLFNIALLANPIVLIIAALVLLGAALVVLWLKSETFRDIVTGVWEDVRDKTIAIFDRIKGFLKAWWPLLLGIFTGGLLPLVLLVVKNWDTIKEKTSAAWDAIKSAVSDKIGALVDLIRGLPGKILGALGNLSRLLYDAGKAIIQGLISGLTDKLGDLYSLAGSIGGKIKSLKGPIDKDRQLLFHEGRAIVEGLELGITARLPKLEDLTVGIAPALQAGLSFGMSPAGGQGQLQPIVHVYVDGEKVEPAVTRVMFEKVRSGNTMPWSGSGFS